MICPTCYNDMPRTKRHYQYRECGLNNVFLDNWPTFICHACNVEFPVLPDSSEAAVIIAEQLLRQPNRFDGAAVLFCRKAMAMDSRELAEILGVDKVKLHQWENNHLRIDDLSDFRLRFEVFERLDLSSSYSGLKEEIMAMFRRLYPETTSIGDQKIFISPEQLSSFSVSVKQSAISSARRHPLADGPE
jgi:hypothetical protein